MGKKLIQCSCGCKKFVFFIEDEHIYSQPLNIDEVHLDYSDQNPRCWKCNKPMEQEK